MAHMNEVVNGKSESRFVTPMITVNGKLVNEVSSDLALSIAYMIEGMATGRVGNTTYKESANDAIKALSKGNKSDVIEYALPAYNDKGLFVNRDDFSTYVKVYRTTRDNILKQAENVVNFFGSESPVTMVNPAPALPEGLIVAKSRGTKSAKVNLTF